MTYEYNPYTLSMYSDQNSATENTEDRNSKEEELEDVTKDENATREKETEDTSHGDSENSQYP